MRDSQSLLEQLLSLGSDQITLHDVHAMLGTARDSRLSDLASALMKRDAPTALAEVSAAIVEGVDAGQLAEQLLGMFRDMMTVTTGCTAEMILYANPDQFEELREAGGQIGR